MNICWKIGKARAREIFDESLKEKRRSYISITSILNRMVKKGVLEREMFGPFWLYEPAVSKADMIEYEIESFMDMVFNKSVTHLVTHLAEQGKLSSEIIEILKKIIEKKEKKK